MAGVSQQHHQHPPPPQNHQQHQQQQPSTLWHSSPPPSSPLPEPALHSGTPQRNRVEKQLDSPSPRPSPSPAGAPSPKINSQSPPAFRPTSGGNHATGAAVSSTTPAATDSRPGYHRPQHSTSVSVSSQRSGGILAIAAAALDRSISSRSEPRVRSRPSLGRLFTEPNPSWPHSRPYSEAEHNPSSERASSSQLDNKMHQTSSRLLRMTDDDRPFTKDFKDLFATLIVSLLPLSSHRVRLTKVEHTFLSEDAINNLGSLKFSQSNRMPDPKDPSRIVTTTTTTTFSMAKDMARSICQRFLEARFIESADGRYQQVYTMKGSVWQLTPKGITILDRFCSRNGIQQKQVAELVGASLPQLVLLERDGQSDKLLTDRGTIEVIFRRFIGANGPNIKSSVSSADSDSLSDYKDGLTGVKMAAERKVGGKTFKDTFTGKAATDWLMDCSTTVDRRETVEMASLFVEYDLIEAIQQDRQHMAQYPSHILFQPTKHAIYQMTPRGRDLVLGNATRGRQSESEGVSSARAAGIVRDSNTQRLDKILNDPPLRLLFRENLRETHCEENLSFYLDVDEFVRQCKQAIRAAKGTSSTTTSMDTIKEIMAQAYGIYNAFLAPGSPCELNIDHQLRNNLATRMTKAVGQDVAMIDTLTEVTALFEDAQNAVFKLMASDSVPKFLRSQKYEQTLSNYDFDSIGTHSHTGRVPERSQSRSNRK